MNKKAVLGAIGIKPGERPARNIRPESHPPSEAMPAATTTTAQIAASGLNLGSWEESVFIAPPVIRVVCKIIGKGIDTKQN
jgi:hypothetical protein